MLPGSNISNESSDHQVSCWMKENGNRYPTANSAQDDIMSRGGRGACLRVRVSLGFILEVPHAVSFTGCTMVDQQASARPMLFFPSRELGYFDLLCFRLFNLCDFVLGCLIVTT